MLSYTPEIDIEQRASEIAQLRNDSSSWGRLPSFKDVAKEDKQMEYEKAIKGYLEGFKFDPSFYHIHPRSSFSIFPNAEAD
ncbi:hypothetical protein JCM5353_003900 [Sporobolomyces roseus]